MTLEFHEYADIFPLLTAAETEELADDIRDNGLQEPIGLHDGRILDGRNRYRALGRLWERGEIGRDCLAPTGKPGDPYFASLDVVADPLAFVISKNLHRRHLTTGQRAMVAARIASLRPGANQHTKQAPSIEDASAMVKVGHASVERARSVIEHGVPELGRAVERGDVKVSAAAAIATLAPAEQEAALVKVGSPEWKASVKAAREEETARKKARRAIKERALGEKQRALPKEKFGVIYADPEWKFEVRSEAGLDRAADNHYPTSPAEVIMARPVREIAADDCVLFLWSTPPHERTAMTVLEAWGFTYKSQFVWVKEGGPGTGYWNRGDHETLLVGTRGNVPCPAPGENRSSVLDGRKGRHSEKPEAAYELIEAYFPSLPKIELNARSGRPGWTAWGNEAPEDEGEKANVGSEPGADPTPGPSPERGGEQVAPRRLTEPQRLALKALEAGPLLKARHGWANSSVLHGFSTQTIEALGRYGLARFGPLGERPGSASITAAGRRAARIAGATAQEEEQIDLEDLVSAGEAVA